MTHRSTYTEHHGELGVTVTCLYTMTLNARYINPLIANVYWNGK